jgi:hypothetical protein
MTPQFVHVLAAAHSIQTPQVVQAEIARETFTI